MSLFTNYVTSVGFRLELSKAQIKAFASVACSTPAYTVLQVSDAQSYASLARKGLIEYADQHWILTKEGELLKPLLNKAGLLSPDIKIMTKNMPTPKDLNQ